MRVLRRWSTVGIAAAAMAAAFAAPATAGQAPAGGGVGVTARVAIPADCVLATTGPHSRTLTCSNRPAGQQWRLLLGCKSIWAGDYDFYNGTTVIGNGTSSASCPVHHQAADLYNRFEIL